MLTRNSFLKSLLSLPFVSLLSARSSGVVPSKHKIIISDALPTITLLPEDFDTFNFTEFNPHGYDCIVTYERGITEICSLNNYELYTRKIYVDDELHLLKVVNYSFVCTQPDGSFISGFCVQTAPDSSSSSRVAFSSNYVFCEIQTDELSSNKKEEPWGRHLTQVSKIEFVPAKEYHPTRYQTTKEIAPAY
jgi:hypothetical protein